ncbi:MAG: hypothetical protein PQJ58_13095 [Spirochaetales bacterium]|nr:hypothetical protein [Spirochaetales bacterium]
MLKIVSFHFGVGSGHFFGGVALWQQLKMIYGSDFHFMLFHDLPIEIPFEDDTLESVLVPLEPELLFSKPEATVLYQYLNHLAPDLIIVDTIWVPAAPLLHFFKAKKVFYSFFMPEFWFGVHPWDKEGFYPFNPEDYDLCLARDPVFGFPGSINIPPVINVHETLNKPPEIIRKVLQVSDDKKLALIAHNGEEGEIEKIMEQADIDPAEYCQRSLSSFQDVSNQLFPLSHYMSGIDLAIGGAGYHFFWETKYYNIPSIYIPQPRIGNEQHWRLENCSDYDGPYDGAEKMVNMILELL